MEEVLVEVASLVMEAGAPLFVGQEAAVAGAEDGLRVGGRLRGLF